MRQYSIKGNGGSAPVRRATSTELPDRADLEGMLPGPVRFQWRVARCDRTCSARRGAPGTGMGTRARGTELAVAPGQLKHRAAVRRIRSVTWPPAGLLVSFPVR